MLAEDSRVNQKVAVGLLKRDGHEVTTAINGKDAIAAWESELFDVILMDVEMPELDGLEATGLIRQNEKQIGIHTPIIAMTAHAMDGDREKCLSAGMDGYIAKPIRSDELFATMADVLSHFHKNELQTIDSADANERAVLVS